MNPTANATPGSRFRTQTNNAARHAELVRNADFVYGIDVALAEYHRRLTANTEPNLAAPAFFKLQGAQEFVAVLKNLAEEPARLEVVDRDNLPSNRNH